MPDAANVIQLALTPVFLLAGTAGCLNVFTTRLARLSDRVGDLFNVLHVEENLDSRSVRQLTDLRRRALALEAAVILCTSSGVFTCLATLGLFIGAIREDFREQILLWFFGGAIVALSGSFVAFLFEMIWACRSMLKQIPADRVIRRRHRTARALVKEQVREENTGD
jgi:hypothetical protein